MLIVSQIVLNNDPHLRVQVRTMFNMELIFQPFYTIRSKLHQKKKDTPKCLFVSEGKQDRYKQARTGVGSAHMRQPLIAT